MAKRCIGTLIGMCLLAASACGGDGGGAPGGPDRLPTPTGLAIAPGTDLIKVSGTETYAAAVTMSDGTTRPATAPAWTSSNPAVATVDAGGGVRGLSAGTTNIGVSAEGLSATRSLRVVPDYQGSWSGTYRVATCADSGGFRDIEACGDLIQTGEIAPIALRLTQSRDAVSGTLAFGGLLGDATGTIQAAGELDIRSSVTFEEEGVRLTITVLSWNTRASEAAMTGTFQQRWTASGIPGDMTLGCEIVSVTRTSTVASSAAASSRFESHVRRLIARLASRRLR